jgi:hypothetical protein
VKRRQKIYESWKKFRQINAAQTDQYHNLVEFRETSEMSEIQGNFPKFLRNSTKLTREGFPDAGYKLFCCPSQTEFQYSGGELDHLRTVRVFFCDRLAESHIRSQHQHN